MFSNLKLKPLLLGIIFTLFISLPSFAVDLTVSYIDIGQGDSELIELPEGKNILIDAGDKEGADKLINYLKERKIKKLDLVIISHPHLDHYGGLLKAIKVFPVGQVLDSGAPTSSSTYLKLLKELSAQKVKFKVSRRGDQMNFEAGITLKILAPEEPLLKNTRSETNNSSIVAKLTYNKISFLFPGDIESESQDKIIKENPTDLKADILKVAHHGSRYTSSLEFLKAVNPKIAVISSGAGNSYEHPHPETLKRLEENKINVYRTDLQGTIIVSTDGSKYKVETKNSGIKIKNQTAKTDLNNATNEELELLPGFNADKARELIKLRPVKSWTQLKKLNLSADEMSQMKKLAFVAIKQAKPSHSSENKENSENKGKKVNINTATMEELVALPGIGDKTAEKIIKGRPYKSVDDLGKIPGIAKKRLNKIIELVTIP